MRQTYAIAATLLLSGSAQAADLAMSVSTPTGEVRTYSAITEAERQMVNACHAAIAQWAAQFDPVELNTTMSGPAQNLSGGDRMAELLVVVDYNRLGGIETRSATIACTVTPAGAVAVAEAG